MAWSTCSPPTSRATICSLGLNVDNLLDHQYQPYLDSDAGAGMAVKFTLRARLGG